MCVCVSVVCHQRPDMRITDTHQPPPPPRAAGPSLFFRMVHRFSNAYTIFSLLSRTRFDHMNELTPLLSLYMCVLFLLVCIPPLLTLPLFAAM